MSTVQAEGFELYLTVAAGTRNSGNDYSPNMLSAEVSWPVVRVRLWENLQKARVVAIPDAVQRHNYKGRNADNPIEHLRPWALDPIAEQDFEYSGAKSTTISVDRSSILFSSTLDL